MNVNRCCKCSTYPPTIQRVNLSGGPFYYICSDEICRNMSGSGLTEKDAAKIWNAANPITPPAPEEVCAECGGARVVYDEKTRVVSCPSCNKPIPPQPQAGACCRQWRLFNGQAREWFMSSENDFNFCPWCGSKLTKEGV